MQFLGSFEDFEIEWSRLAHLARTIVRDSSSRMECSTSGYRGLWSAVAVGDFCQRHPGLATECSAAPAVQSRLQ